MQQETVIPLTLRGRGSKPPDLDSAGNPIAPPRPPDLDADGNPIVAQSNQTAGRGVNPSIAPAVVSESQPQLAPPQIAAEPNLLGTIYDSIFNAPEFITQPVAQAGEMIQDVPQGIRIPTGFGGLSVSPEAASSIANFGASMLSPANAISMLMPMLGIGGRLANIGTRILGGMQVGHGAHEIYEGNTLEGLGDIAFGALDLKYPPSAVKPQTSTVQLPSSQAGNQTIVTGQLDQLQPNINPDPNFNQGLGDLELAGAIGYPHAEPHSGDVIQFTPGTLESMGIAPNEQTGRVAKFAPVRDEYQKIANEQNVTMSGVHPERGVPIVHNPEFGGFQHHRRGNEAWVTHPMLKDPVGPFKSDDDAFDWVIEFQDSPEFQAYLKQYNSSNSPAEVSKLTESALTGGTPPQPPAATITNIDNKYLRLNELREKSTAGTLTGPELAEAQQLTKDLRSSASGFLGGGSGQPPAANALQKLEDALKESVPLNKKQKEMYHQERVERVGRMQEHNVTDFPSHYSRKGELRGPYGKVEIRPLSEILNDADFSALIQRVEANVNLLEFEKIHAIDGLDKLRNGVVPQPNEIREMIKAFGFGEDLLRLMNSSRGIYSKTNDLLRSMLTGYDLGFLGRQARGYWTYPEYWKGITQLHKYARSEEGVKAMMDSVNAHPNFQNVRGPDGKMHPSLAKRAELDMTDTLTHKEELFISEWVKKIPGMMASERMHRGYLNKLRADIFNRNVELLKASGVDVTKDTVALKDLANVINNSTGRGSLGRLDTDITNAGLRRLVNNTFFAPRLHMGRLRMYQTAFNPYTYRKMNPATRRLALRTLLSNAALGISLAELANMSGAFEVSHDPTNTDFMKIKATDNTRIDPFSGDQQYTVAAARFLSGQTTSSTSGETTSLWGNERGSRFGGQTTGGMLQDFAANRAAPIPRFVYQIMFDKRFNKETIPEHVMNQMIESITPIIMQDLYAIAQDEPALAVYLAPLLASGIGVQTYGR